MNNLAETLREHGDLAGARGLQEQVLDLSRRVLGAEHPDTLTSMNNLASTLQAQGDLAGARGLHEQALDIRRRVLGGEHPNTSVSAFNLFGTLLEVGEPELARDVFIHHLAWLLERDPATLGADQRLIRQWLVGHYGLDSPSGGA
jgi:tetratricopeptide repeat protein